MRIALRWRVSSCPYCSNLLTSCYGITGLHGSAIKVCRLRVHAFAVIDHYLLTVGRAWVRLLIDNLSIAGSNDRRPDGRLNINARMSRWPSTGASWSIELPTRPSPGLSTTRTEPTIPVAAVCRDHLNRNNSASIQIDPRVVITSTGPYPTQTITTDAPKASADTTQLRAPTTFLLTKAKMDLKA